ncbi:hypothetical protein NP570_23670, partial [Vibrio parahaemolyticus]|nr:hypothetical protein [Vibrio parahaemolyticus]
FDQHDEKNDTTDQFHKANHRYLHSLFSVSGKLRSGTRRKPLEISGAERRRVLSLLLPAPEPKL